MSGKRALIRGTAILTITSFVTRFMGFFYRIFLGHTFGEENVGLYQLVFPVYALGISFSCDHFFTTQCTYDRHLFSP